LLPQELDTPWGLAKVPKTGMRRRKRKEAA